MSHEFVPTLLLAGGSIPWRHTITGVVCNLGSALAKNATLSYSIDSTCSPVTTGSFSQNSIKQKVRPPHPLLLEMRPES